MASLPVLCLMAWLSTAYGYALADTDDRVALETGSVAYLSHWQNAAGRAPEILVTDRHGRKVARIEVTAPVAA
ncbi:MAG: hypothetical protein GWN71_11095, partial [Gammaproteobacteria bacterium]|nr:hypothetical protein [Gammaproteobacteria bacterium]